MGTFLLIGMGGFLGAILRYALSDYVQNWSKSTDFPIGTLVVNLVGCLLIGALAQLAEAQLLVGLEHAAQYVLAHLAQHVEGRGILAADVLRRGRGSVAEVRKCHGQNLRHVSAGPQTSFGYAPDNGACSSTSKQTFETFPIFRVTIVHRQICLKVKLRRRIVLWTTNKGSVCGTAAEQRKVATRQRVRSGVEP